MEDFDWLASPAMSLRLPKAAIDGVAHALETGVGEISLEFPEGALVETFVLMLAKALRAGFPVMVVPE